MKHHTLKIVMPIAFINGEYDTSKAYKMKDIPVVKIHYRTSNSYREWPGTHKNVHIWAELKNGYAVGCNENPARGLSFPVHKL